MAKAKQYKVIADVGVVGFRGVIHAPGDVIDSSKVPPANLKAWLRFNQIEEISEKASASAEATADSSAGEKGRKNK